MIGSLQGIEAVRSKRTNFLSIGVLLSIGLTVIMVSALPFVSSWIAVWLLALISVLALGTFGVWFFHALKNPRLLDSEEHRERMATIPQFAPRSDEGRYEIDRLDGQPLTSNPALGGGDQNA